MHNHDLQCIAETFGKAHPTAKGYTCLCPVHDDSTPSLSLSMDGDTLLVHCFAGCDPEEVLSAVRDAGFTGRMERNENFFAEQTAESKKEYAQKIWKESYAPEGSPVETYLRARGYTGEIPDSIAYHPCMKHAPSGQYFPAMIAAVTIFPSQEIVAIHRTYLKPDGSGKADVEPDKMMLGSVKGGAVMFGPQSGMMLHVAEGIETALSIFLSTGAPTWATLSASNMENLVLPSVQDVPLLLIGADPDIAGLKAAMRLGDREDLLGRSIILSASVAENTDFNDLLMR